MNGSKLQPGHLFTREERRDMRILLDDLNRRLELTIDPDRRREVQEAIVNVERERAWDRETRPRKRAKPQGRRR